MNKNMILTFAIVLGISSFGFASVQGESSFELTCRAKAKEIAADTYRNCVSENRNAEIDRLKKDYKERLKALKDDYEKEIEQMGSKKVAKKSNSDSSQSLPGNAKPLPDESRMDLPEPIPVEDVKRN